MKKLPLMQALHRKLFSRLFLKFELDYSKLFWTELLRFRFRKFATKFCHFYYFQEMFWVPSSIFSASIFIKKRFHECPEMSWSFFKHKKQQSRGISDQQMIKLSMNPFGLQYCFSAKRHRSFFSYSFLWNEHCTGLHLTLKSYTDCQTPLVISDQIISSFRTTSCSLIVT